MRSRIIEHRRIKAGELVPHELNPRIHSDAQRQALRDLYDTIGFARSLLAYRLPDGKLKLIDGHLRQSVDPEMEVEVEVLDVNDTEARALLLSIDPLAQLADYDNSALDKLRAITATDSENLLALWNNIAKASGATQKHLDFTAAADREKPQEETYPESYAVLVHCADEKHQLNTYRKLKAEGMQCKLLTS